MLSTADHALVIGISVRNFNLFSNLLRIGLIRVVLYPQGQIKLAKKGAGEMD